MIGTTAYKEVIKWAGFTGCQEKGPYIVPDRGARMITALKRFTNQDMQNDLWQGGFHDHIIRSEADYLRIWAYMDQNPAKWREDRYHEEAYP